MEDNNNILNDAEQQQPQTLEDKFTAMRQEWMNIIEELSNGMKNPPAIDSLLNVVYTKRQKAVELHGGTNAIYGKQLRAYKQKYAAMYNEYKTGEKGIRYTSDSSIQIQIEAALAQDRAVIEQLREFLDYMMETIKTIDNLIYGINTKVTIYKIMNKLDF
jgi:hypothetical protein